MSANLWRNVASGVADADHRHPLPGEGASVFVIPAVNARASECIVSWRGKHDVYVMWKPAGQNLIEQRHSSMSQPGKSDRGSDGRTYWPEHTSTASKMCLSSIPSLSTVTTSHWPEAEKSGLCVTLFTLVWNVFQCKCYTVPILQPTTEMWVKRTWNLMCLCRLKLSAYILKYCSSSELCR